MTRRFYNPSYSSRQMRGALLPGSLMSTLSLGSERAWPDPLSFRNGLGDAATHQILNASVSAGAATSALIVMATVGGPVGAAAAGIIAAGNAIFQLLSAAFSGCGQTCVAATAVVNQIEPYLKQNVEAYLSSPVHYQSLQTQALATFDATGAKVVTACSNPSLGEAGQRCISDRQQGSCKYQTSPGGWSNGVYTAPGPADSGSTCWNWFVGYRDPIAQDPTVVPDPSSITTAASTIGGDLQSLLSPGTGSGASFAPLLLAAGLVLLAVNL
jgi:hypothetical protein